MAKLTILVLGVALACLLQVEGKVFSRCGLVQELRRQGFPEGKMRDWVCLVEAESSRSTSLTNTNKNGSKDYGLFQINDRYWCTSSGAAGKDCNVKCGDLLTDDISKASTCAKKVYRRHKFMAWYGWRNKCQGKPLPDISAC